jgi:hypothetical protein
MSNKNLFKEAIADAKAVREAALANAKAALEEALTPKLQSMLAAKLNEMEDNMDEYAYEDGEMEEGFTSSHDENADANLDFNLEEEEDLEEDFDLSEILAELDEEDSLEEAKKEKDEKKKKMMKEGDDEEEEEEEDSVADMTIDDLKALIADIVAQEMGDEEGGEMEAGEEETEMEDKEESDEIDLEELLAELDEMDGDEDLEEIDIMGGLKKGLKKVGQSITGASERAKYVVGATPEDTKGALGLNLSAEQVLDIIKANYKKRTGKEGVASDYFKKLRPSGGGGLGTSGFAGGAATAEGKKAQSDLNEAIRTINTLRRELNEVNLLNAKLLYVNKIFKAKNLSESQKLQVIASFDKATTAKEAKVVFESLNYTLTTAAPKQAIKESLGFASKAAGVAPRKAIVESNDVITRMQKLANIIK